MPVLSERDDIIVITDERTGPQYDTLAMNMRRRSRTLLFRVHRHPSWPARNSPGRSSAYVSVYNFRDSIEDGATVPLYYENRILDFSSSTTISMTTSSCWRRPLDRSGRFSPVLSPVPSVTRSQRLEKIADDPSITS